MDNKIDWSKSHNGVLLCSFERTIELMPEVAPILNELRLSGALELPEDEYVVDVKVHMLMPGQYPCIPDWHCDFIPRDSDLNKRPDLISGEKMYLWVSGEPTTEFRKTPIKIKTGLYDWVVFTQRDSHRGVKSNIHTWRCFIRVIPKKFIHSHTLNVGELRRHSQVYLDSNNFNW